MNVTVPVAKVQRNIATYTPNTRSIVPRLSYSSALFARDHTRQTTQPKTVQAVKKSNAKIDVALRLRFVKAIATGKKYSPTMLIRNQNAHIPVVAPTRTSLGEIAQAGSELKNKHVGSSRFIMRILIDGFG